MIAENVHRWSAANGREDAVGTWSRDFGLVVKVDLIAIGVTQDEDTKEPCVKIQSPCYALSDPRRNRSADGSEQR